MHRDRRPRHLQPVAADGSLPPDARQAVPVVDALTPAASRMLLAAIARLREDLHDCSGVVTSSLEPVYLGDGKASVAVVLSFNFAALNAAAKES